MHQLEWWECPRLTPARCLRQRAPPCEGGRGQNQKPKKNVPILPSAVYFVFPSLCGRPGQKKKCWLQKKKRRDEDASLTCALKRLLVFSPLSLYLLLCLQMHRGLPKKKTHTREMQLLRRLTVGKLQMLRRLFVGYGRASCYFLAEPYLLFVMDWGLCECFW